MISRIRSLRLRRFILLLALLVVSATIAALTLTTFTRAQGGKSRRGPTKDGASSPGNETSSKKSRRKQNDADGSSSVTRRFGKLTARPPQVMRGAHTTQTVVPVDMNKDLRQLPHVPSGPKIDLPEFRRHGDGQEERESRSVTSVPLPQAFDAVRQLLIPTPNMPGINLNFDGQSLTDSGCSCSPPDTIGDIGSNHYIQNVNSTVFKIWDKTGTQLQASTTFNALWGNSGTNPCTSNQHFGDPVVFYDKIADRWVMSDFAFAISGPNTVAPYYECIAVAKTSDPVAGGWWLYAFQHDPTNPNWLGDYPKFGDWLDGWYGSYNMFCGAASCTFGARNTFQGVQVNAYDRTTMLTGAPTTTQIFRLTPAQAGDSYSFLPARYRFGAPPLGRDEFYAAIDSPPTSDPFRVNTTVHIYKFHADFGTPANSTFTGPTDITVAGFIDAWDATENTNIVPQSGTAVNLDTVGDRLFMNLWYQNLGGVESLWATHTIRTTTTSPTAIRWYQFNVTGGTITTSPTQQGTWDGGADGLYRWMPSLAVDKNGNMAVGYSVSSGSTFPSIRYNGRLTTDTAGTLGQGESTLFTGSGSFTSSLGRWGDYSATSIDPTNGCTFWHTNEYLSTTGTTWRTRVGSFAFSQCAGTGTLTGTVTNSVTSAPISGASVTAGPNNTTTNGSGVYTFNSITADTYNVTVTAIGFASATHTGVVVANGGTTIENFALSPLSCTTRTWVGAGAGGAGTDFNTATNWNPVGVPQNCDDLVMTLTNGATITLSADSEIHNLTASISGPNNVFRLDVGTHTLQIDGTTTGSAPSGNGNTQMQFNVGSSPGQIIYGGDATFSSGGTPVTFPILGVGNTTGQVVFKGNATFNAGSGTSSGNTPAKVIFDGTGTQTITDNAGTATILLGNASTEIGGSNSPTVLVAGSASNLRPQGNLNVNNTSTLDLSTLTFNRNTAGGTLTLNAGTTLKLAASTGGQAGSNYPSNFTTNSLNATSTVDYNAAGGTNQTIYNGATYGHLTLSRVSGGTTTTKTAGGALTIAGNVTISTGAIFAAGTSLTHSVGGNWTNNGAFSFTTASTINFNGSSNQIISGSASTAFNALTSGAAGVTMNTSCSVSGLLTLNGDLTVDAVNGKILTATGSTSAGTKDVIGTIERADVGAVARSFGNSNNQITNGSAMTLQVLLVKSSPTGFAAAVNRIYTLNVVAGTVSSATVQLHYLNSELNGNVAANLHLWREVGSPNATWTDQGVPNSTQTGAEPNNWIRNTGVTGFSSWTMASAPAAPTLVTLKKFGAVSYTDGVNVSWESGYEVENLGYHIYRERNGLRERVTPAVVAGSALKVGPRSQLRAGYAYSWFDSEGTADAAYYLESIDLHGGRAMAGPIYPARGLRDDAAKRRAPLLGESVDYGYAIESGARNQFEQTWPATMAEDRYAEVKLRASAAVQTQQMIAGGPAVKISVSRTGWYRITQPELLAAGLDPNADPRRLQLFADGVELPIVVNASGGRFDAGDSIEFYGQALDTLSTATHVYWLINGTISGKRINRPKPAKPNNQDWSSLLGGNFPLTTERQDKLVYFASLLNGEDENIFGPVVTNNGPTTQTLTVTNLDPSSNQAQLSVTLQGATEVDHVVQVQLNGTPVGIVSFQGREHPSQSFAVARALLNEGTNVVTLSGTGDIDVSLIDSVSLTYAHSYRADNDALRFSVAAGQTVIVSGFSSSAIRVIDITDPATPIEMAPSIAAINGGYAFKLQTSSTGGARTFMSFTNNLASHAAAVTANQPSSLTTMAAADMLIVTHRDYRAAIEPLAAQRRSEGLTVTIVDVEDVYDEFSFGAHSPAALRDFLSWTNSHWAHAPRYLLLVGDSSWDPRNSLDQGFADFVPTKLIDTLYLETASDDWFTDFDGDGVADVATGRLPARTADEAALMVNKILAYERERQAGTPLRGALMVSDSGFESETQETAGLIPPTVPVTTINRADGSDDLTRAQIVNNLNTGPLLANYFGHGSVTVWTGAGLLDSDLATSLTNNNRPTLFVMMTCLNGYSHDAYIDSLAESLFKAPNGGAMAVWASSGFTEPQPQFVMSEEFYRQLFSSPSERLGDAFKPAKAAISDHDVQRTWLLLGDPSMRLR